MQQTVLDFEAETHAYVWNIVKLFVWIYERQVQEILE